MAKNHKIDLVGQVFGRLTVLAYTGGRGGNGYWECGCSCGEVVEVSTCHLRSGHTQSCGCYHAEITSARSTTHGESINGQAHSREYRIWQHMKRRCDNPKDNRYHRYGGRGIYVCARWLDSFENFLADMGRCPEGKSIDREDNDGPYEPNNCRWATAQEQAHNRGGVFAG